MKPLVPHSLDFEHHDKTVSKVLLEPRGDVILGIQVPNKFYNHFGAGIFKQGPSRQFDVVVLDVDETEYADEASARKSGAAMLLARNWERRLRKAH